MRLLFAFGHPEGATGQARLDREQKVIAEEFRNRPAGRFEVSYRPAATVADLSQALDRHRPHVLHLSAHGDEVGLTLQAAGSLGGHVLPYAQLAEIVTNMDEPPSVVVLNACYSVGGAPFLLEKGSRCVIAMSGRLTDQAAAVFAGRFYGSLADGQPVFFAVSKARDIMRTDGMVAAADCIRDLWLDSRDREMVPG